MNSRSAVPVLLVLIAAACADATSPSASRLAPLVAPAGVTDKVVNDEYIVVLNDDADVDAKASRARGRGGDVFAEWKNALKGYAVRGSSDIVLDLRADPDVKYVEVSQEYSADVTQNNATWGLDRIDQPNLPLNGTFVYTSNGAGVTAYIVDTGILTTHNEFGGRATWGANFAGGPNTDCNGHGTHVAGTVGGTTYGVAKGVSLVAVKVLNCAGSGSTTGVVSGIDWVRGRPGARRVANMSLGGGISTTIDNAVNNAVSAGVVFAVAAGNSNANACNYSPARAASAITVGATTSTDARASYSNFGTCLDIFAPGSSITSAWKGSNTATNTISGTSMATPHVTGVAAAYWSGHTSSTAGQVISAVVGGAVLNKVTNAGAGSPNKLLQYVP